MPSTVGIDRSISTTSGRSCRAIRTASPPSSVSPITSQVGLARDQGTQAVADDRLMVGDQDADGHPAAHGVGTRHQLQPGVRRSPWVLEPVAYRRGECRAHLRVLPRLKLSSSWLLSTLRHGGRPVLGLAGSAHWSSFWFALCSVVAILHGGTCRTGWRATTLLVGVPAMRTPVTMVARSRLWRGALSVPPSDDTTGESFRGLVLQLRGRTGLTQRELASADRRARHARSRDGRRAPTTPAWRA